MKYKILFIILLLLLNISTNKVFAVSAYPYPIKIKQPDNSELTIQLVGDEFFHYTQTTDGLLIRQNEKGVYEKKFNMQEPEVRSTVIFSDYKLICSCQC